MSAPDLWIQLNYQLIHLVDFLPVSNWSVHADDTAFIVFRDLYDLLTQAGEPRPRSTLCRAQDLASATTSP